MAVIELKMRGICDWVTVARELGLTTKAESGLVRSVSGEFAAGWVWAEVDAGNGRSVGGLVSTRGKALGAAVIPGAVGPEEYSVMDRWVACDSRLRGLDGVSGE